MTAASTTTVPEALERKTAAAIIRALDLLEGVRGICWDMDRLEATGEVLSNTETVTDLDTAQNEMAKASGTWDLRQIVQAIAETVAHNTGSSGGAIPSYDEVRALRERFTPVAARDDEVQAAQHAWIRES